MSANTLTLTWPADHTGYRLVVRTNTLANGSGSNSNDWMTVAGTTTNNLVTLPLDKLIKSKFYRLVNP